MEFPTLLYRCPGPYSRPGGTYATLPVADAQALAEAEQAGWMRTMPEAVAGRAEVPPPDPMGPDGDGAPTREELLQHATEIGLKVDGRWSYARLANEIAAKGA